MYAVQGGFLTAPPPKFKCRMVSKFWHLELFDEIEYVRGLVQKKRDFIWHYQKIGGGGVNKS